MLGWNDRNGGGFFFLAFLIGFLFSNLHTVWRAVNVIPSLPSASAAARSGRIHGLPRFSQAPFAFHRGRKMHQIEQRL